MIEIQSGKVDEELVDPQKKKRGLFTYAILGLRLLRPSESLHHTAIFIGHVLLPIGFARSDQDMRGPGFDIPIKLMIFVDGESVGVRDRAVIAIGQTIRSINLRDDLWEEHIPRSGGDARSHGIDTDSASRGRSGRAGGARKCIGSN